MGRRLEERDAYRQPTGIHYSPHALFRTHQDKAWLDCYLEEAYFGADYCLLASWWHPREKSRGLLADQIRGDAWALRNLGDAAWMATGGDAEQAYFEEKIRNNLAHRTAAMYGPPEFNRLGARGLRTVEDARIQNPANPRWIITWCAVPTADSPALGKPRPCWGECSLASEML